MTRAEFDMLQINDRLEWDVDDPRDQGTVIRISPKVIVIRWMADGQIRHHPIDETGVMMLLRRTTTS